MKIEVGSRAAVEVAEALLKACLNRALEAFGNGLEGTALNEELVSVLYMVRSAPINTSPWARLLH